MNYASSEAHNRDKVTSEIKKKKVKYIITAGQYKYEQKLFYFTQRQKKTFETGPYIVFEVNSR